MYARTKFNQLKKYTSSYPHDYRKTSFCCSVQFPSKYREYCDMETKYPCRQSDDYHRVRHRRHVHCREHTFRINRYTARSGTLRDQTMIVINGLQHSFETVSEIQ